MSIISTYDSNVLTWNKQGDDYLKDVFSFAQTNLHNDSVLVFIHLDNPNLVRSIYDRAYTCHFYVAKDWWGLNELHLKLPIDLTELVSSFFHCQPTFPFSYPYVLY